MHKINAHKWREKLGRNPNWSIVMANYVRMQVEA